MTIKFAKRVAAEILNRGESAIRINTGAIEDVSKAMTREDVKRLIKSGSIYALKAKKNLSMNSKRLRIRRSKGRGRGPGKRHGTRKARQGNKWMKKVRSQRMLLRRLKDTKKIDNATYNKFYRLIKGSSFADKASFLLHLKERGINLSEEELNSINEYIRKQYQ